jgi:hypothetical protein
MSSKQRVIARAQELGVEVTDEWTRESYHQVIEADAPGGHRFKATDTHAVCSPYFDERGSKAAAWTSLLDDMEQGVEPCPPGDEECRVADCPRYDEAEPDLDWVEDSSWAEESR